MPKLEASQPVPEAVSVPALAAEALSESTRPASEVEWIAPTRASAKGISPSRTWHPGNCVDQSFPVRVSISRGSGAGLEARRRAGRPCLKAHAQPLLAAPVRRASPGRRAGDSYKTQGFDGRRALRAPGRNDLGVGRGSPGSMTDAKGVGGHASGGAGRQHLPADLPPGDRRRAAPAGCSTHRPGRPAGKRSRVWSC